MRPIVFRDQDATAGFFIQAVNYAGSKFASNTAQVFNVMQQGIDKRPRLNACARMHHHAGRFIDHNEMIIFKEDLERDIFGCQVNRFRPRLPNHNRISAPHLLACPTVFTIQRDAARRDKLLNPAAGKASYCFCQKNVYALFCLCRTNDNLGAAQFASLTTATNLSSKARGSPARINASPINAALAPAATTRRTSCAVRIPLSLTIVHLLGILGASRSVTPKSSSNVARSRLLIP